MKILVGGLTYRSNDCAIYTCGPAGGPGLFFVIMGRHRHSTRALKPGCCRAELGSGNNCRILFS
ncbi:hypothetical protein BDZ91DRAFT_102963 [Kalaharituber pfeilii]|nr:hypothetical protein BDZ91DRAFT_102963 [Kalaharituber pfeilii]